MEKPKEPTKFNMENFNKNEYINVSEEVFQNALVHYTIFYDDYLPHDAFPFQEEDSDFVIYIGDINNKEINLSNCSNLLIIGNVTTNIIDFRKDEYKTFQVTGNVECKHLNLGFEIFTVIGGNLTVTGIFNSDYEDSDVIVNGNVTIDFLAGYPITVGGKVDIKYGDGSAIPKGYWDLSNEEQAKINDSEDFKPKFDFEDSLKHLKIQDINREVLEELIEKC